MGGGDAPRRRRRVEGGRLLPRLPLRPRCRGNAGFTPRPTETARWPGSSAPSRQRLASKRTARRPTAGCSPAWTTRYRPLARTFEQLIPGWLTRTHLQRPGHRTVICRPSLPSSRPERPRALTSSRIGVRASRVVHREYHKWRSDRLDREMEFLLYGGDRGEPVPPLSQPRADASTRTKTGGSSAPWPTASITPATTWWSAWTAWTTRAGTTRARVPRIGCFITSATSPTFSTRSSLFSGHVRAGAIHPRRLQLWRLPRGPDRAASPPALPAHPLHERQIRDRGFPRRVPRSTRLL